MSANLLPFVAGFLLAFTPFSSAHPQAGNQSDASIQATASAADIRVENWTPPQHGWLYVLDPKPGGGAGGGAIWLVDPEAGKVVGRLHTGDNPDFALSPDGSRLYVASAVDADSSKLAVIDTARGEVLKSGMVTGRLGYDGIPPFLTMAVSGDGLVLRILIDAPKSPDKEFRFCSPPSIRGRGNFYRGSCTWEIVGQDDSSLSQRRIASIFSVREPTESA